MNVSYNLLKLNVVCKQRKQTWIIYFLFASIDSHYINNVIYDLNNALILTNETLL